MYKIKIIKANRGFWKDLFNETYSNIRFLNLDVESSELISDNSKRIFWRLSQLRILDYLGIFQSIKTETGEEDGYFSYNRFLKTGKPYILGVENPTAMVHYHPQRALSFLGKRNLKKVFNGSMKTIVCLSKACLNTLNYYYNIPSNITVKQIYPLIKDSITSSELDTKVESETINCLFVSSQFFLKGGRELLEAIKTNNWNERNDIHFDIITSLKTLNESTIKEIKEMKNVSLFDYSFSKKELNDFYKKSNIFINLTRKDSFSLVTLEALKYGCAFIATDLYAIKEMVHEGYNGYLTKPVVKYWNDDNTMNTSLSKKENQSLEYDYCDKEILEFLSDKMNKFIEDRELLKTMQINSYNLSNSTFNYEECKKEWESTIQNMFE